MPDKFTIEFECADGLWFVKSHELNCFVALRDLKALCSEIPEIVRLVDARKHEQDASK